MRINPIKSKAIRFTKSRATFPLNYSLMGKVIPQTISCKYLDDKCREAKSSKVKSKYKCKVR